MAWGWFLFGLLVGDELSKPQIQCEIQIYQCPCCSRQSYLEFGPGRPKKQYTPVCQSCCQTMNYQVSYYR